MEGDNRRLENLTHRNWLFLSAAAQNNHEALLPMYQWPSSLLFVMRDQQIEKAYTAKLIQITVAVHTFCLLPPWESSTCE
jgi:hypothetical protein